MSSHGGQGSKCCTSHRRKSKCGCKKCKGETDYNYQEEYSNFLARKEKCKPKQCVKCFTYNGVYISQRKCCPELTDWLDVFNGDDSGGESEVEEV